MKALLVFPPGWMQFGPYLSLPLLKGYLGERGIGIDLLDLNIEFYDWVLSTEVIARMKPRLNDRLERQGKHLDSMSNAKLCKALFDWEYVSIHVEAAKNTLRAVDSYVDPSRREWAKRTIADAMNVVESGYDGLRLTLGQLHLGDGRVKPGRDMAFLQDPENIIHAFYESIAKQRLTRGAYEFVGFSLPAWEQLVPALTIARALRNCLRSNVHLCMGGNFITRLISSWGSTAHPYTELIDTFSVYEGEESLRELLVALQLGKPLDTVSNLAYSAGSTLKRTPLRTLDLDSIPAPNFDGLPLEKYFAPEPILPLFASRSCPYKCSFCTIPFASSEFRERKAERVAADIAALSARYRTRLFTFVDETLTPPTLAGVARELISKQVNVYWYGETRFDHRFDEPLAQQLFQSGCRKLQFGLESYNQRVLNLMKKGTRLDRILPNVHACLSAGIAIHLFTFVGFPGETEQEARQTHTFSESVMKLSSEVYGNDFSTVGLGAFGLEPHSDVYRRPEAYGVQLEATEDDNSGEMRERRYSVATGLGAAEAERLVAEFEAQADFEDVSRQLNRIRWNSLAGPLTNEDEAFVLYAITSRSSNKSERHAAPRAQGHAFWTPGSAHRGCSLAEGVEIHNSPYDFLDLTHRARPSTYFYYRRTNVLIRVSRQIGNRLQNYLAQHQLPEHLSPSMQAAVDRLLRYGLVTGGEKMNFASCGEAITPNTEGTIRVNPDVRLLRLSPSGRFVLFNSITEDLLSVSAAVAWLFSMADGKTTDIRSFVDNVLEQEPRMTETFVNQTLSQLMAESLITLLPPLAGCESSVQGRPVDLVSRKR